MSEAAIAPIKRAADKPFLALGIRLFAVLALATMALFVRLLSNQHVGLIESMFYRNLIAAPIVLCYIGATNGLGSVRSARFGQHLTRALVGVTGMVLTFESYRELQLADATTIGFTSPIFSTVLAATVLREQVGIHRWSAVVIGFLGVLIVTHPGSSAIPLQGALISLGSAFIIAIVSILLRQLGRTESAATTAFWFCFISACMTTPFMLWDARVHNFYEWALFIGLGVSGAAAQVALTASVKFAPISTVVSMDYTALIWATLFGWSLFAQLPATSTWIGAPLIIASGLYIAWREHTRARQRASASMPNI